jgi:hypothetical protein
MPHATTAVRLRTREKIDHPGARKPNRNRGESRHERTEERTFLRATCQILIRVGSALVIVLFAGSAGGQTPPSTDSPGPSDEGGYPRAAVDRPLIPPTGIEVDGTVLSPTWKGNEGDEGADFLDFAIGGLLVRAALGGNVEVFGGAALVLLQPDDVNYETLYSINAGAAFRIGQHGALHGIANLTGPTSDVKLLEAEATYVQKRKIAAKLALVGRAGTEFVRWMYDDRYGDPLWKLSGMIDGTAVVQATSELAVSGRLELLLPLAYSPGRNPDATANLYVSADFSIVPKMDVYTEIAFLFGETNLKWFTLGARVRL